MNKTMLITFVLGMFISLSPIFATATSHLISLQGYVTDNIDEPLATGDVAIRIYDASTDGNLIFDSGTDYDNTISNGIFDVLLGSVTPLSLDNTVKYYMEIDIDGQEVIGDATTGRREFWPGGGQHTAGATYSAGSGLSLVGTTFAVKTCSDNQILRYSSSDWICSSGLVTCSECNSVFALLGHTHNYAGSGTPGGPANDVSCTNCISDNEVNDVLTINNGLLYAPTSGNVGIGTSSPTSKLEVIGDAKITGNLYVGCTYNQYTCTSCNILEKLCPSGYTAISGGCAISYSPTSSFRYIGPVSHTFPGLPDGWRCETLGTSDFLYTSVVCCRMG